MKNLFTILAIWAITIPIFAQQQAQFTQFMFNKIAFNPAYAGSHDAPCFSGIYRTRWLKLEGAPVSQNFSFHTPLFGNRVGFGINIQHDQIGPTNTWNYGMMYAYRMKLGKGNLSFGVQGQIRDYRVDWRSISAVHSADALYGTNENSKLIPNFGIGLYYGNDNFYAGVSIPRLLNGDLTFEYDGTIQNTDYSQEVPHAYFMGGLILPITQVVKLKPAVLVKYANNAPLDIDLHGGIIFYDRLNIGATYRVGGFKGDGGESIDFILQMVFTDRLKAGVAYDYTLSDIRNYQSGTYELIVEYCLTSHQKGSTNPRFF